MSDSIFLIYGTPDCSYCDKAKTLLTNMKISYIYNDLTLMYENWKDVFTILKPIIKGQTKIPIIFRSGASSTTVPLPHATGDCLGLTHRPEGPLNLPLTSGWTHVGGYFELEVLLEDMELNVGDKY